MKTTKTIRFYIFQGTASECVAPSCYCIPKDNECFLRNYEINPDLSKMERPQGDHDFDYRLVINVTNNAKLSSIFIFKVRDRSLRNCVRQAVSCDEMDC